MKTGILLLNMGGPNNIDEVEMFLRNMFADKNILPTNPLTRKLVGTIIIKKRLSEAKTNYESIGGKSPLAKISMSLASKVEDIVDVPVALAMRYVPPFASDALQKFHRDGIEEIVLFPMYPQYSTTTTMSSVEDVRHRCRELGYAPKISVIAPYANDSRYVEIQVDMIEQKLMEHKSEELDLILSAHGLPLDIIEGGDPYEEQVEKNVIHIKKELKNRNIIFNNIILAYQSKVGGGAWLEPNLVDVLRAPRNLNVLIFPMAFTVDNSETIFELDIEHREIAQKIGYEKYLVAKCPNDSSKFANLISSLVAEKE